MKVAVITANMSNFDKLYPYAPQSMPYDRWVFTDQNFPPRYHAMTPRLQARIPKCFGWQMAPGYDVYIWVDASYSLQHRDSVKWFVEQVHPDYHIAVLKHPMRDTITEEAAYIKTRLLKGCPYITPRYANELIEEELNEILSDPLYEDNALYASTAFAYANTPHVHDALKEWWYHISRYHIVDQLGFPYALRKNLLHVKVIQTKKHHDFRIPYLSLTRYLNESVGRHSSPEQPQGGGEAASSLQDDELPGYGRVYPG